MSATSPVTHVRKIPIWKLVATEAKIDQRLRRRAPHPCSSRWISSRDDDRQLEAFGAFVRSAERHKSGALGISFEALAPIFADLRETSRNGLVALVTSTEPNDGFRHRFYEPQVIASPVRTCERVCGSVSPLPTIVDVDDSNRPDGLDPYFAFARQMPSRNCRNNLTVLESGALSYRGLEIAFVESPVDAFSCMFRARLS